jgi:nicotinamidase-related amidase
VDPAPDSPHIIHTPSTPPLTLTTMRSTSIHLHHSPLQHQRSLSVPLYLSTNDSLRPYKSTPGSPASSIYDDIEHYAQPQHVLLVTSRRLSDPPPNVLQKMRVCQSDAPPLPLYSYQVEPELKKSDAWMWSFVVHEKERRRRIARWTIVGTCVVVCVLWGVSRIR